MLKPDSVSGIILAGGEGRRLGGQDKGWLTLKGQPMIRRVLKRLAPQVSGVMISANRNLERYRQLGYPVITDHDAFQGPLGGIASCLHHLPTEYGLVVPVDAPWIPANLLQRLATGMPAQSASVGSKSMTEAMGFTNVPFGMRAGQRTTNGDRTPPSSVEPLRPFMPPFQRTPFGPLSWKNNTMVSSATPS